MFTWCSQGCRNRNGFSHSKAFQKSTGFPQSPDYRLCSHLHPLEETGERLWKAVNSQVTLFAPSLMWRGAESKSHPGGERESLQAPLHRQGASRHSFQSSKHMLEGPVWVESLWKEAEIYGCMKGETSGNTAFV